MQNLTRQERKELRKKQLQERQIQLEEEKLKKQNTNDIDVSIPTNNIEDERVARVEAERVARVEAERVETERVESERVAREQEEKRLRDEIKKKEKLRAEKRKLELKKQQEFEATEQKKRQKQKEIIKQKLLNKSNINGQKLYKYTKELLLQKIKFGETITVSKKQIRYDITGYKKITIKISTPNKYRISLIKQDSQINDLFHLSSRKNSIIYNTHINNVWGKEIKKQYTLNSDELIYEINSTKNSYIVNMNGKHFMTTSKKNTQDANVLLVNAGDKITIM